MDYYNILINKPYKNKSSIDIYKLKEIFQDLPIKNKDDGLFNTLYYSSNLYLLISAIFNNVQRLNLELNKTLKSKVIDIDKLKFIKFKIENEIPGNSPINKTKYNKIISYSNYLENFFQKIIKELRFNHPRRDLEISKNEELDHNFQEFFNQVNIIQNNKSFIDFIFSIEINDHSFNKYDSNNIQNHNNFSSNLENNHIQHYWVSRSFNYSFNPQIFTRKLTSKKIRSLIEKINKFQKWENTVHNCYNILKNLENHSSSNQIIESFNNDHSTFKEKYQRFLKKLDIFQVNIDSFIEEISLISKFFDKNREILIKSKFFNQYKYILQEYNKVRKLEDFLKEQFHPNFYLVLLYFRFVLESKFSLLPRKSYQSTFIFQLEKYSYFETYIINSLKIQEISFQDIIILSQYFNFKTKDIQDQFDHQSLILQNFIILLNKLLNKFSENFKFVLKVYLMLNSFQVPLNTHIFNIFQQFQDYDKIFKYLLKNNKIFNTPIQGIFNYLLIIFDPKLKSQVQNHEYDPSLFFNIENINKKSDFYQTQFSFDNYQKYFLQIIKETDFDGHFQIFNFKDSKNIISIPLEYKIKLIQRYYIIETLSILLNNELSSYNNMKDLIVKILDHYDSNSQLFIIIWRNLRLLYIEENMYQGLDSLCKAFSQEPLNLIKMIKEKMIVNDELYNYFMRHLTEKILINFKGKNSISESIDDYLQDLDYIMNYNFINEINKIELISEIDEIKLLDQNIQEMIEKLNGENFKNKKELIENILDYELDLQNDLNSSINNKKSLNDTIYIHQPISYDEEMIRDQLNIDFPIKKKNEFFSKLQINDLFNQESIKIIKSKDPNMKNLIQKKDDIKMTKEKKNIVNLVNRYLSIIEDERNQILLLLGILSKYTIRISMDLNENELLLKLKNLFKDLIEKKKVITINTKLFGYLINDWIHFEIAFIINIARMNQIEMNNDKDYFILKEWFNDNYLRYKTPYKIFNSCEKMLEKNENVSLLIFKLIKNISMKYLNLVNNWDKNYLEIVKNTRENDKSRDFYNVLLVYNQSKVIRKLFQGDLDSTINRFNNLSENEICQKMKSERIKEEYQRLRGLFGDLMLPFKDYMNETFNDIVRNGLYNMRTSSKFLVYFPSILIESLRSKEFVNLSVNPLRIFIEEISMIYFSKDLTLLLVKINMTYKCEIFYIDAELLITLSSEIELKSSILIESLFMDSYNYFIKIYKDSLIDENYYYISENRMSQDKIELVNNKIDNYEEEILNRLKGLNNTDGFLIKNKIGLNLRGFKMYDIDDDDDNNDDDNDNDNNDNNNKENRKVLLKRKKKKNRFIIIRDIIDLILNIILYRVFISGILVNDQLNKKIHIFRRNHSLLDFDLGLKSMIMYFSLKDIIENSFKRCERISLGEEIFSPKEIFDILKEISRLIELFNKEEILLNIKDKPKIHHNLFEKELMIMEDFRCWEITSDIYFFKEDLNMNKDSDSEFILNRILWIPEYENFNTILDMIDLILFHIKKIRSFSLDCLNLKDISILIDNLENKKKLLSELEEISLKTLKEIKQDEKENSRFETKSKNFLLLEKIIYPPKISQKTVYELISKKLVKLIPNFKVLNKSLNILPFKGFEILDKYFNNSILTDKNLNSILNKMSDLENNYDLETKQELKGIVSHNLEYLLKMMELRKWINESKLSSEILYRCYLKFFRGILRYFLIYGSNHRWVDLNELQDHKEGDRKKIFVPILEYSVLRRIYEEFLSWYKFPKSEVNINVGVFQSCEFIILECLLSCCRYLMEKVSFNINNMDDEEYLINHCVLRYLYYFEKENKCNNFNSMIGILDIGDYLSNYLGILDMELIMRQDFFKIQNSEIVGDDDNKYQLGSFSVFSRVDNRLIHHFLRKNKIQVSICGIKDAKFGLISNIYYIKENMDKIDFKWSIGRISYSLKPIHGFYFLRSYVRQYLEYIFKAFYNKDDQDYIKKKDHSLYLDAFGTEDQLSIDNLFKVLDKYLKDVMDYSLRLMLKSFKIKSYDDHSSYSNLSKYPDQLEKLNIKWMIFGQDKWINQLIQIENQNKLGKSTKKKRVKDDRREEAEREGEGEGEGKGEREGGGAGKEGIEGRGAGKGGENILEDSTDKSQVSVRLKMKDSKAEDTKKRKIEMNSEIVTNMDGRKVMNGREEKEEEEKKEEKEGEEEEEGRGSIVHSERLKSHEGIKSDLKFTWLGWLSFGIDQENGDEDILEIGIYQISNQFTKRNDNIIKEMSGCLDLRYNGVKRSMDLVGKALGNNSVVVLISSNWSHHLRFCKSKIFSRIFHYNYNYEDYEIFEFELVEKNNLIGDVRLWIFPCNITDENSNRLFFSGNTSNKKTNSLILPISRYYLIGMLVLSSEINQNYGNNSEIDQSQEQDEEISVLTSLLPNQGQMHKIAQYCHNKSIKSDSKMEFLINNDMFSSAGTLLSSLLSVNSSSNQMNQYSSSTSNQQDNYYSNNICTLRDLANSLKRKITQG
ncbi:Uncharacterized protein GY17_00000538 [Cryptosporidium hominis]|uniref:Uncharacterized protein n=2 Tax=Cryptosporidium hominis TaxID=237895 RepID=A0ABX5BH51_CRYHO|nr:Uncharacterized protein GY17_00000538 [Cryptosporidium hominis]|eukprot:PPS97751.1 Uncharacterized protein GY17_00000538 [Cryptosporidium hominis]